MLNEPEERHKVSLICGCTKAAVAGASPPVIIYDYQPGRSGCLPKTTCRILKVNIFKPMAIVVMPRCVPRKVALPLSVAGLMPGVSLMR